jgi:hypothetical protein
MPADTNHNSLRLRLARFIGGHELAHQLATVSSQVDDTAGWVGFQGGPHDRDASEIQDQYDAALEAWRKNPIAKRIVDCITDYVLGDGMTPSAAGTMGAFINRWWNHEQNNLDRRLPELCDELSRAGDLFLTLHRNPVDGLSYVRPIPKDAIVRIETLPNDWETEIAYYDVSLAATTREIRRWLSPAHPDAAAADAIMVHYAVNKVTGALLGESDLATMIPWLLRYSRMIEDRVRLHWASRAFLWIVTVPTNLVQSKREQYRTPPDTGSIIVKDSAETWDAVSPDLKGFDAQFDTRAVRQMIDAGSGLPPHWRGEAHDVSLATAEAMEHSASRHLRRRQLYVRYIVQHLCHVAYTRAWQLGKVRTKPSLAAITVETTDIDRVDNQDLAASAHTIAQALEILHRVAPPTPQTADSFSLRRLILRMVTKFAGERLTDSEIDAIMAELDQPPVDPAPDVGAVREPPEQEETP